VSPTRRQYTLKEIKDHIHHCTSCTHFPCTEQPLVDDACEGCPIPIRCCMMPVVALMPCERGFIEANERFESATCIQWKKSGECYAYQDGKCTIYDKRPVVCRIAQCAWTRGDRPMGE